MKEQVLARTRAILDLVWYNATIKYMWM
jgi:hypothetical protein